MSRALDVRPGARSKDFLENLNTHSLKVMRAVVSFHWLRPRPMTRFQSERHGYFVADRVDHAASNPVFNLAVELKDNWTK